MSYKNIRSLGRGVAVLHQLNSVKAATAASIAQGVGLPRPTVYRILDTLVERGLIYRSPSSNNLYRVTGEVAALSDGFEEDHWTASIGSAVLEDFAGELVWPADLATYEDGVMVIWESTRRSSPFRPRSDWPEPRRSMLQSALGRAYLAFCGEDARAEVLQRLRQAQDDEALAGRLADQARAAGFADCRDLADAAISALAVPVLVRGEAAACLGIEWTASAMDYEAAVDRYLPVLKRAAAAISTRLSGG